MRMRFDVRWVRVAFLVVTTLTACGGESSVDDDLTLESSEAAVSCQVTQQCTGTSVSCGSASGVCTSGADNGGWVQCDGTRTYCPSTTACTCQPQRFTVTGYGVHPRCSGAYAYASQDAHEAAALACPRGVCNTVEAQVDCIPAQVSASARVSLTFSCMGPPNCQ
ncbi:hypothetical protein LXT21_02960 [Myxococcus sp. K38C18041901]|uniref:hypothetical protein n=1 Tax=Myxococcus guangdongensis TaxID=2906760 RepID=UPI0020A71165|nr:hypothetical protein [Myxococcus guangdongensis]MCP3057732.1 hypothetical protein [Myxococcus guangdongensis]